MAIEGMVVIALDKQAVALAVEALPNIPIVAIDTEDVGEQVTAVGIDNATGAALATRHLINLGHKHILHIAGPATSVEAASRMGGYEVAMRAANLEPMFIQGDWSAKTGHRIGSSLDLSAQTAVFTANDHLALGLLKAMNERGVRVPEQLSVVGFDDLPEAPYLVPGLTTIRQDFNQLGEAAMALLLDQLAGRASQVAQPVLPSLIVRESTTKPGPVV
jgi:DNA-binding LacI/PurR family transcriptional regulator